MSMLFRDRRAVAYSKGLSALTPAVRDLCKGLSALTLPTLRLVAIPQRLQRAAVEGAAKRELRGSQARCHVVLFAFLCACLASLSLHADEPLTDYKANFERGLVRFKKDDMAGAVAIWNPIVQALGDTRAYRLLYNLGVAYDRIGDATAAANRFERFLARVQERRSQKQDVPAGVQEFETDAQKRLSFLREKHCRIHVLTEGAAIAVRIDGGESLISGMTYYVVPGPHEVTLRAGASDQETRAVTANAGELIDITATSPAPAVASSSSRGRIPTPPKPLAMPVPKPALPTPFSPLFLFGSGAFTVASIALPLVLRAHADTFRQTFGKPSTPLPQRQKLFDEYYAARTRYELSWIVPSTLAVATGVLSAWYLWAPRIHPHSTQVGALILPAGAWVGLHGETPW